MVNWLIKPNVDSENILKLDVYTVNNWMNNNAMTTNKTQYHHGDLASAFMDAAIKRIAQEGVEKLSLRAVARDLGVSQTALYRHFTDKTHLLSLLSQQGFQLLAEHTQAAAAKHKGNTFAAIMALGMAYLEFAQQHPEHYRLMFGGSVKRQCDDQALMNSSLNSFTVILNQTILGVERGVLIDRDPRLLARSCWANVHGMAMLMIDGFYAEHSPQELRAMLSDMLWIQLRGTSQTLMPDVSPF